MELNQGQAAAAQAEVSLQQASMRALLAASEIKRPFPELALPAQPALTIPQPVEHDLAWWQEQVLAESRVQQLLAKCNSADSVPDPTVGLRYSNEKDGEEKVAGIFVSIPLSFGMRGANSDISRLQADIVLCREIATRRRLEGDVFAAYTQAAARSVRENTELVARAYSLGESRLTDALNARRLALESSLAATVVQLDANLARYRLLLDAHMLLPLEMHSGGNHNGDQKNDFA